jgi:hypothetical protein
MTCSAAYFVEKSGKPGGTIGRTAGIAEPAGVVFISNLGRFFQPI